MTRDTGPRAFLRACALDVAVRKPGNVSHDSAGHGMQAAQFEASAAAAVGPLFDAALGVGQRIEAAVDATWAVAGCNTNLGILLLSAPLALAWQRVCDLRVTRQSLHEALRGVLDGLSLRDAEAAFRGIARASPGGLGSAPTQDVRHAPSVNLREAMALAAARDRIARQYRDGFDELFECAPWGFSPGDGPPLAVTRRCVQMLYLSLLSQAPDSHIVRIHGDAVAQTVMAAAHAWLPRARAGADLDTDAAFVEWDLALKARRINPGTTADLTVAALLMAGLVDGD